MGAGAWFQSSANSWVRRGKASGSRRMPGCEGEKGTENYRAAKAEVGKGKPGQRWRSGWERDSQAQRNK